ncbi:MAG: hypothetical protein KAY37_08170 [Phycisphaerae bacterium]|nr:hypothetical protein [Phycisphaerae bacterium]
MLDAEGRVAVDAPCVNCGYNLRTLKADALCPECAHPVAEALHGYYLRFASPRWVKSLARGMLLILIGIGASVFVAPLLSGLVGLAFAFSSPQNLMSPSQTLIRTLALVEFLVDLIPTGIAIVGLFYLTRPDPEPDAGDPGRTARRLIRVSCFLLPIPLAANLLLSLTMPPMPTFTPGGPPPSFSPAFADFAVRALVVSLIMLAAYVLTPLALMHYLATLMRRIPRPGLVRFARVAFWGLLFSFVLFLAAYAVFFAAAAPTIKSVFTSLSTLSTAPGPGTASTAPATATTAPAITTTAPASFTVTATGPGQFSLTTSAPSTRPASMPFAPPFTKPTSGTLAGMIIGGLGLALGGCASMGFTLAGVILLIITCIALFGAAREAAANAELAANAEPTSNAEPAADDGGI